MFREKFPSLGDKTVLYVGRLERSKGLHYLVPAFARVLSRFPMRRWPSWGEEATST